MSVWSTAGRGSGAFFRPKPKSGKQHGFLRSALGAGATLGAMWLITNTLLNPPEFLVQTAARPAVQHQEWVEIVKPFPLYALPSATFGAEPRQFSARRHASGGGRADALVFGAEEPGKGNWLRVEILRSGRESSPDVPFYPEIARQAARSGSSIARSALPDLLQTRFGGVEFADVQVVTGDRFTACIGFRLGRQEPGIAFSGLACGTAVKPMDRQTLACTLDRLDLIASGDYRDLGNFFAERELRRGQDCSGNKTALQADRPGWLTPVAGALPLKGSITVADARRR